MAFQVRALVDTAPLTPAFVTNYTPTADTIRGHFEGIDAALANAGPWDKTAAVVHLDVAGDTVAIGAAVMSGAGEKLRVIGDLRVESGQVFLANGDVNDPSLTFISDPNTGLFRPSQDELSFTTGGTEVLRLGSSNRIFAINAGTVGSPTIARFADQNTGIYWPTSVDALGFVTGGSEAMRIDASQRIGMGADVATSAVLGGAPLDFRQLVHSDGLEVATGAASHSNFAFTFSHLTIRSRGTLATPLIVVSGDGIVALDGYGFDGTDYEQCASIGFEVDGTPGAGDMPGRIVFRTTPDGAAAWSERMRINESGQVLIGTTSPTGAELLKVDGAAEVTGKLTVGGAIDPTAILFSVLGSRTAPIVTLTGDPDTGVFWHTANQLGLTMGGAPIVFAGSAIILNGDGPASSDGANVFVKVENGVGGDTGVGGGGADLAFNAGNGGLGGTIENGPNPPGAAGGIGGIMDLIAGTGGIGGTSEGTGLAGIGGVGADGILRAGAGGAGGTADPGGTNGTGGVGGDVLLIAGSGGAVGTGGSGGVSGAEGNIIFQFGIIERARLTGSGQLLIGTAVPTGSELLNVAGDVEIQGDVTRLVTATFLAEFDNGSSSASDTIDWNAGQTQRIELAVDTTVFTFTNPPGPGHFILAVGQDLTGGRRITWPGTVIWPGGITPTLTTDAGAFDLISFDFDGTSYYGTFRLDFQ